MLLSLYFRSMPPSTLTTAFIEAVSSMVPREFKMYFDHVQRLEFAEKPDYDALKKLFRDVYRQEGFSPDHGFDWEIYKGRLDLSR